MATLEINGQIKTIQDIFFSKENIIGINKKLLEKHNLADVSKETKKKVIDLLIKNMKMVYKSIDLKKLNQKNLNSIFQQFNKTAYEESTKSLTTSDISLGQANASQLKFERDFRSNPNVGNKLMDRPVPSQSSFALSNIQPPTMLPSGRDNKFDKLFKPIVDNIDENYTFNQYQFGKGSDDVQQRIDRVMSERDNETRIPGRPQTPDFLKPLKTQTTKDDDRSSKKTSFSVPQRGGKPDFTCEIPAEELNQGFLAVPEDTDLYNINNIDKPINIKEIQEDGRSFEERLKHLEKDRGAVNIIPSNKKIDFQMEQFPLSQRDTELDQIPEYEPMRVADALQKQDQQSRVNKTSSEDELEQIQYQIEQRRRMALQRSESMQQRSEVSYQRPESMQQRSENMQQRSEVSYQRPENMQQRSEVSYQKPEVSQKSTPVVKYALPKDFVPNEKEALNKNININKIQNMLKKMGLIESAEIEKLKNENLLLKEQLKTPPKIDLIKQEITNEFQKLNEKDLEITKKEADMLKKEHELKLLLTKYNYLYGTSNIQLDISPIESNSNFTFEFEQIENIVGIKLMSYSIPQARYNIEDGKNNIFKFKVGDDITEIKLNTGKYMIEDLIRIINTKTDKLIFELNYEQKVEVKYQEDTPFEIITTVFSNEVLGFTLDTYTGEKSYIANRSWELRVEDKIYLYLTNLDDKSPFAVLYTNNQGNYQFKFEEPIVLNKLDLLFKDSKGRQYNFFGLNYNINVQLEIHNPSNLNL